MDLYEVLGVRRDATEEEIKKAYRSKAREFHPDVNHEPGAEDKFKEVSNAYEILSDPQKKQNYDTFGDSSGQSNVNFDGGFNFGHGFNFGGARVNFSGDPSDIFEQFFGPGANHRLNSDLNLSLALTPKEFLLGCTKRVNIVRSENCSDCEGEGGHNATLCSNCTGKGFQIKMIQNGPFMIQQNVPCSKCSSKGKIFEKPCGKCYGTGKQNVSEDVDVNIPANCPVLSTLQIKGRGNNDIANMPPGNLNITLNVNTEGFVNITRDGSIHTVKEIKLEDWYNNNVIKINRYDVDEIEYDLSNFKQSDKRINFAGRGLRSANNDAQGDFIVAFRITK